jgi:hypothetical protein
MWLLLNNIALTWDLIKNKVIRVCESNLETIAHLILFCPFTEQVWREVEDIIGLEFKSQGDTMEATFKRWHNDNDTKIFKVLSLTLALGIWLAKNAKLFEKNNSFPFHCTSQALKS